MRDIKYRVWDGFTEEYLGTYLIKDLPRIDGSSRDKLVYQQFTGLTDVNSEEVYEGDIVSFVYHVGDFVEEISDEDVALNGKEIIALVQWEETMCSFYLVSKTGSLEAMFPTFYAKTGEVIGNIHENPELLK